MRAAKLTSALLACAALLAIAGAGTASAEFGFKSFGIKYADPYTKEPTTQAGVHADLTVEYVANQAKLNGGDVTDGQPKGPGDWPIPVPPLAREQLSAGKRVVAGLRPEHLEIGEAGSDQGSFQARADVVEYLGNEELLHVNAADKDIVAIVDSEHRVKPGDIVNLIIPLSKLHLFDGETGAAMTAGNLVGATA